MQRAVWTLVESWTVEVLGAGGVGGGGGCATDIINAQPSYGSEVEWDRWSEIRNWG